MGFVPKALSRGALALLSGLCLCALDARADPARRIRFCDELLISVSAEQILQQEATVAPNGLIEIAGGELLPAAGLTPEALARSIETAHRERNQEVLASVSIVRRNSPDCSVVTLPLASLPAREAMPQLKPEFDTKRALDLWMPDDINTQDGSANSDAP